MAFWFATASTCCIIVSAALVARGWRLIRRGDRQAHQRTMLLGAVFALLFFIIYMAKTVFVGSTAFGGPENWKPAYIGFLLFHIALSSSAAVFGIVTLALAFSRKFARHRRWGRVTAAVWLATAATGIVVYVLLYVLFPGGRSGGLIDAILNR